MDLINQKKVLKEMVHRVVVNQEVHIIDVEWLPPFGYLQEVSSRVTGETTCLSAFATAKSSNRVFSGL